MAIIDLSLHGGDLASFTRTPFAPLGVSPSGANGSPTIDVLTDLATAVPDGATVYAPRSVIVLPK